MGQAATPDLLASLTTNIRPTCDLCESKCGQYWYRKNLPDPKILGDIHSMSFPNNKSKNGTTPEKDRRGYHSTNAIESRSKQEQSLKVHEHALSSKNEISAICSTCFNSQLIISTKKSLDYVKISLSEELKKNEGSGYWGIDEQIKLLETFEECNMDIAKVLLKYPGVAEVEVVKNFLKIPVQHFKNFARLTNQHFENIFKKDSIPKSEPLCSNPLFEYV